MEEQNLESCPPNVGELLLRLASSEPSVRNRAALDLRDLAESGASIPVEPFFTAVADPANRDNRGTLVYALQMMDCSEYFTELFELALHGNFECQNHALTILDEQPMRVAPRLLREAEDTVRAFTPPMNMSGEVTELLRTDLLATLSRLGGGDLPDPLEDE